MPCSAPHPAYRRVFCQRAEKCENVPHTGQGPRGYWITWDRAECRAMREWGQLTRKEQLIALVALQRGRCFWCNDSIATPAHHRDRTFVFQTHYRFGILDRGAVVDYGVASLDHVIPRWMHGDNRQGNLVAACVSCNMDRGFMHSPLALDPTGFDKWIQRIRGKDAIKREDRFGTNLGQLLREVLVVSE